jgi:MFS transporter, ACS family, pantothenate transporter
MGNSKTSTAPSSPVDTEDTARLVIQEKPRKRWTSYLWDTFDKSPEERRFLFKLDAVLLSFASLGKSRSFARVNHG